MVTSRLRKSGGSGSLEAGVLWRRPDQWPELAGAELHIWRFSLDLPEDRIGALESLLSGSELDEAERRADGRNRRRYVVARGVVRSILAAYAGCDPAELDLQRQEGGKPCLAGMPGPGALSFNLSHSGELALCAVARERAVGIDVERVRTVTAMDQIVDRYFSEREARALKALPSDQRLSAFFAVWTGKEACGKALGAGVTELWQRFEVSEDPNATAESLQVEEPAGGRTELQLCRLRVGPGYLAAVAAEGSGWGMRCWDWE